jgi:ATP-dependent DNA helicase RecQ
VPALLLDGLTVVVSPLISLMKDQVEQLHAAGVPALFLNSTLSAETYRDNMEQVRRGEVKLLYLAPETLMTPRIFSLLDGAPVSLFTIDEAHCISEWGHDFRPEYRQLVGVRQRYPKAVCMALTATATIRVREDIQSTLGFSLANEFVASFNRENLYIQVVEKIDPLRQTLKFLERFKDQSGIIYCFSRRQVDELASDLQRHGYSVRPYHAGLTEAERKRNQEDFIRDDVQIIVATIAFGMGINKPNVRFVMHYDLPKSIEEYYQEIGRAGRDGLAASCLLLFGEGDIAKQRYFINQKNGQERKVAEQHLQAMVAYAENDAVCRRKPLMNYFGEVYTSANCNACDHCRKPTNVITVSQATVKPKRLLPADLTVPAQKFLSCVKRGGESHGSEYIIDVLLGIRSDRVLKNGHDKLSTFGIGSELNREEWQTLAQRLLASGYLKEYGKFQFATLSLTETALAALYKRLPIELKPLPEAAPELTQSETDEVEYNHALFALLRQKRKELADGEGVPPYVIFPDRTLVEMSVYYPQKLSSLASISGVGKVKLERYGSDFLLIIRDYCKKHGLKESKVGGKAEKKKGTSGSRTRQLVEAYADGQSIESLAVHYGVLPATVLNHLTAYVADGNPLRCGADALALVSAPAELQAGAAAGFAELGTQYLKPVFDKLEGKVSYDDLRVLRFIYLCNQSNVK